LGEVSVWSMPFTYSFHLDPSRFVVLRASGAVTLITWANAMQAVVADRAFRESMPVLLDITDATELPQQIDDIAVIARTWRLMAPYSRGAIVTPEGAMFGVARQIEQHSDEHVRVFTDLNAALQWVNRSGVAGA
jgi:hypothetical protein